MYKAGDHVVYGSHGVCAVTELRQMVFGTEHKDYYVLSPINDKRSTIFIPVDSENLVCQMKRVLTKDEIDELLYSVEPGSLEWIPSDSERKAFCTHTLKNGDRLEMLHMIDMLYMHRERMKDQKKHFHVTDEKFLREAEKLLHDEFSFVLGIPVSEVGEYIGEKLKSS
ncbi:MAG: hypothetical protein IJS45_01555 [Clostridia bacterium]|nr:hypothetical protein [Clostridia bacterium]